MKRKIDDLLNGGKLLHERVNERIEVEFKKQKASGKNLLLMKK